MSRTPDWKVERIALGELPPEELARARAQLLSEPDGAARLQALEQSNRDVLSAHAPADVAAEVARRAHLKAVHARTGARSKWTPLWMGLPVAAALALVFVIAQPSLLTGGQQTDGLPDTSDRIKGQTAHLVLQRQRGLSQERLEDGAEAAAGEVLQVSYVRAAKPFGVILSIDGSGAVTRHLPEAGDSAARLTGSGATALAHAYELDAAPAFERFFFVTSDAPFTLNDILPSAKRLASDPARARTAPLDLPARFAQSSFLLEKSP